MTRSRLQQAACAAPFAGLLVLGFSSRWWEGGHLLGNLWALCFVSCMLLSPPLARRQLWLGYAALLYPLVALGLHVALDWGSLSIGWE
ncbi:MAG: hypothetical protein KBC32_11540 [Candidatus Didemnitutus sp.]|nr:hypothetical protein [Candidatus Didemnitutus sp.]